jgi:hypothetical protein
LSIAKFVPFSEGIWRGYSVRGLCSAKYAMSLTFACANRDNSSVTRFQFVMYKFVSFKGTVTVNYSG